MREEQKKGMSDILNLMTYSTYVLPIKPFINLYHTYVCTKKSYIYSLTHFPGSSNQLYGYERENKIAAF